jgi:hypothetical protein
LPATQSSAPVSYFRNGRQYILMHVADSATSHSPAGWLALTLHERHRLAA